MTPDLDFIRSLPKTELHIHIEGALEPEMMFGLAERNGFDLPFESVDATRKAYSFTNLQSFLDIYYQGAAVLQTQRDFYDLMFEYLKRVSADGVRHAEVFFDPQTHTARGIGFEVFMPGFRAAIADAESSFGITSDMIMCFLRHLGGDEAVATLAMAELHLEGVIAVGLDSTELNNPPELFAEAYDMARDLGLRAVAHAGEEGPPGYVWGALDILGAERIEHGVRSMEDPQLVARLRRDQIPLTVCPLSNVALRVFDRLEAHPIPNMLNEGLMVSVNSDDPAYFGGYVADNYAALARHLDFPTAELGQIARNSIQSSFMDESRKADLVAELDEVLVRHQG